MDACLQSALCTAVPHHRFSGSRAYRVPQLIARCALGSRSTAGSGHSLLPDASRCAAIKPLCAADANWGGAGKVAAVARGRFKEGVSCGKGNRAPAG
jgi:hypothetical protein